MLTASTVACSGSAAETRAPATSVPEPITIAPVQITADVTGALRAGSWSTTSCGDACSSTELRFVDDGTLTVRSGHQLPGNPMIWQDASSGRYDVADGVVRWSYGAFEHRATFVEGASEDGTRAGWAMLGFRAGPDAPTRFVHEHFDSVGAGYPTTEVAVELVFDAPLEDAARLGCGAALRARIHVTVPAEPPWTESATEETITLRGRIPCRIESIADSDELRVHFADASSPTDEQAWQRWWQAHTVGPAPQSVPAHDALRGAMSGVLVADPSAGTLRGPIGRLLHGE